jgi:glycosyltransferase involved in cell wall biosynthesis
VIRVVQIQYSTKSAARSALRLQKAFVAAGVHSDIVSLHKDPHSISGITYLGKAARLKARVDNKMQERFVKNKVKAFGLFSYPYTGNNIAGMDVIQKADIIYVHWVMDGFMSLANLEQLAKLGKPVVFVMHDMWNITGGCHYSFTCDKYIDGCNNCQVFATPKTNDFAAKQFKQKLQFYSKYNNLYFVSPSMWLYNCAKQAKVTAGKPVFYIPNVLDTTLFKPFDKKTAKHILNIDADTTVIAFGAVAVDSPYKGWPYLQKALQLLHQQHSNKNILLLIFGSGGNAAIADSIPFKTKFMGILDDEYSTMLVYNAADVFVVPSMADNQPTIVQESLCCGTPVVGFNTGGVPDMIKHKENGYLAKYKDAEDLVEGINYCLEHKVKGSMLPSFETAVSVQKHFDLFETIKKSTH